jgi:hypothetical protein
LGSSAAIAPEIVDIAKKAESQGHVEEDWSRLGQGAYKGRVFARTRKGYFLVGPPVVEAGDVICVLLGGKLPFCLRPVGAHHMLVGECYVYGLMKGEAIEMVERNELTAKVFDLV